MSHANEWIRLLLDQLSLWLQEGLVLDLKMLNLWIGLALVVSEILVVLVSVAD